MVTEQILYASAKSGGELAIKVNKAMQMFEVELVTVNTVVVGGEGAHETWHHAFIYHNGTKNVE